TGERDVGGLVGRSEGSTITNSYATGNVTGERGVGGLVGRSEGSTITNSYATGNVTGDWDVGGLVGDNDGTLNNSYRYENQECTGCNELGDTVTVTAANLASATWHENILEWNQQDDIQWSLTNGKYPLLYKKDTTTLLGGQTLINTP
ncbi:MAG: GLUG motif-containing protein, partial [Bacilli bacterium]